MKRGVILGLIFVSVIFGTVWGETLIILYTNDLHTRLDRLSGLAAQIERIRTETTGPVLLFDSGDTWQDYRLPIYAVWGADRMVEWMDKIGYDAMAVGNHDLYYGAEQLAWLGEKASFPLLCANLRPQAGVDPPFFPYTFLNAGKLRVLVIGLITDEYLPYLDYPWLTYINPAQALSGVLERVGKQADLVVVLGHLPVAEAVQIARSVPGIDIFLTGHSHELTQEPVRVGETIILQAGAFGRYFGKLTLEIDDATGTIANAANTFFKMEKTPVELTRGFLNLSLIGIMSLGLFLLLF